jgi:2-methylcitrate dehydratase PrpD
MCRALDFCDAMAPGIHIGSSLVPAALAAAELVGGCDGREFLAALAVGAEVGARLNLTEEAYDGFDPTGVAGVFAATAAAARIMKLDTEQTLNALALAFNRCGGSFQSNVDGSLAVRLIQGWVAESAVNCALFARQGLTGPANFLAGVYGYMHLFARGKRDASTVTDSLGEDYLLKRTMFKKYPSCGLTQGVTELALRIIREADLTGDAIASVEIRLPPYAYRLVGHEFSIGRNARVNAQFSAQYCVANAFVRGSSRLGHFREESIRNPEILDLIKCIGVVSDESMNARDHTAVDLIVKTKGGATYKKAIDFAPGFPRNPLNEDEHLSRFRDCMDYAERPLSAQQGENLLKLIGEAETLSDIRSLLPSLLA